MGILESFHFIKLLFRSQALCKLVKVPTFQGASLVAQRIKHLPPMWGTHVRSLGWEGPLEKEMVTHSSIPFFPHLFLLVGG